VALKSRLGGEGKTLGSSALLGRASLLGAPLVNQDDSPLLGAYLKQEGVEATLPFSNPIILGTKPASTATPGDAPPPPPDFGGGDGGGSPSSGDSGAGEGGGDAGSGDGGAGGDGGGAGDGGPGSGAPGDGPF
jgi:hypothetical protein